MQERTFRATRGPEGPVSFIHQLQCKKLDEGELVWSTVAICISSPRLKMVLDSIFDGYPNWNPGPVPFELRPPFKPFLHRWSEIIRLCLRNEDESSRMEVAVLRDELKLTINPLKDKLEQINLTGVITPDSVWMILVPGDLIATMTRGQWSISRLERAEFKETGRPPYWRLVCSSIEWNGRYSGFNTNERRIPYFQGSVEIPNLASFPLRFMENAEEARERFLARGRKFAALRGCQVKRCVGMRYTEEDSKVISNRVVVDAYAYYKCRNMPLPVLERSLADRFVITKQPGDNERHRDERSEEVQELTDVECILASPHVKAFDLKANEWCEIGVDDIHDSVWDDSLYTKLVLPPREKQAVLTMADRKSRPEQNAYKSVRHEGDGVIIILHGPPGVGKTYTAEAVAERCKVPLYSLRASDLGTSSRTVERNLKTVFECCRLWSAILLLDEADKFLGIHEYNSQLVREPAATLCRSLGTFDGVTFLTTGDAATIDPAISSMADLTLPYRILDESARRKLWIHHIASLPAPVARTFRSSYADRLAEAQLNGKEIQGIFDKARMSASQRGRILWIGSLLQVLRVEERRRQQMRLTEEGRLQHG